MTVPDDYVTDVLMRDLVGHDRRPVSFLVYLWLAAEQQRRNSVVQVSYQELSGNIGISKSSIQAAVNWLSRRKSIAASKENAPATPGIQCLRLGRGEARGGRGRRCAGVCPALLFRPNRECSSVFRGRSELGGTRLAGRRRAYFENLALQFVDALLRLASHHSGDMDVVHNLWLLGWVGGHFSLGH
jgi:hypothetical protein